VEHKELEVVRRLAKSTSENTESTTSNKQLLALIAQVAKIDPSRAPGRQVTSEPEAEPLAASRPDPLAALSLMAGSRLARLQPYTPQVSEVEGGAARSSGTDAASTVLKTVGLLTGVGPIVTGLMSIFGRSKGGSSEPPPLPVFTLPPSINIQAGLHADRSVSGVEYGAAGNLRPIVSRSPRRHRGCSPSRHAAVELAE
jgi:hypothetical protein